jgi:phage FluMu gp28-like protein
MRDSDYFLPFQRAWIRDNSLLRICEKSRQVGMSYADSYDSVKKAATGIGRDVWVISRDERQARQYIRYCRRWARALKIAFAGHKIRLLSGPGSIQAQALEFSNGARIYGLSSNPDAIVGKTGHVKLDEFALHRDQRELYAVAKPVTQWGGTLSVISTHRGEGTVFNELLKDIREKGNPMGWSLHSVPIQRAVEEGLAEKIDERKCDVRSANDARVSNLQPSTFNLLQQHREAWLNQIRQECIDHEQWLQEYCCVPADEQTAFLSYDMITRCEGTDCLRGFDYLAACGNPLYLGVDVARKKDLCVLDVGEMVGDVMWDRMRIELRGRPFAEIQFELYRLLRLPRLRRCCMDATGLGIQLAEEARRSFGYKVEPITFTAFIKEELAFKLRSDFEGDKLRIASDDRLRADLRGIRKEVTSSGHIRFAGESEDSHCDRFWAMALRQHAASRRGEVGVIVG